MKLIHLCKSKIHSAVVTGADVYYEGSIGIDLDLMRRSGIAAGERVCVWNRNTGARIETYAIPLSEHSGEIIINGAAARLFYPGDHVIIAAYCLTDERIIPLMVLVDAKNRFVRELTAPASTALC